MKGMTAKQANLRIINNSKTLSGKVAALEFLIQERIDNDEAVFLELPYNLNMHISRYFTHQGFDVKHYINKTKISW